LLFRDYRRLPVEAKSCSGVYFLINTDNGKIYVGSSDNIRRRRDDHLRRLRGGYHDNVYLQRSWNKYGEEKFTFGVLERCPPDQLVQREQHWINKFRCYRFKHGYNRSPTAGRTTGFKHSKETKEKMAARKRGVPMKPEVRQRISEAHKGKPKSEEWRPHLWDNRRGYKHSEETRKKMSQAAERRRLLGLHPKGRPVSDKVKAAMSARFKGVPKSPEHRAKIAAALKLFWAKGRKPNDS
jgi:group I intron endonuclease